MRIALFSDVHGNSQALKAVLDQIRLIGADEIYCLGDVLLCHAGVLDVAEMLEKDKVSVIRGNHDETTVDLEAVHPPHRAWLQSVEDWFERNHFGELRRKFAEAPVSMMLNLLDGKRLHLFHAHPDNLWAKINSSFVPPNELSKAFGNVEGDILAYGHYHQSHVMQSLGKTLLNVASVDSITNKAGDDFARFTILESKKDRTVIQQYTVPYDVAAQLEMNRQYDVPPLN